MSSFLKNIFLSVFIVSFLSCGGNLNAVQLSPEMEDFVKMFDGKFTGVSAALDKYADTGIDRKDMDTKDLTTPRVTASDKKDGTTCYTIVTNDGVKDCQYSVCWLEKKIVSVEDLSL